MTTLDILQCEQFDSNTIMWFSDNINISQDILPILGPVAQIIIKLALS